MVEYCFDEAPLKIKRAKDANPQKIGDALGAITDEHDGVLKPHYVVDAARDPSHSLHGFFEWEDHAAAEKWRHSQARAIIRAVRIVDVERDEPPRAFLSVNDKAGVSYRALGDVAGSLEMQLAVLKSAERDLKSFEHRYQQLSDICEVVQGAREKLAGQRETAEQEARPQ